MLDTHVIAKNPAGGRMTKQSRNREPVSEIAVVTAFPRNDGRKKVQEPFGQKPLAAAHSRNCQRIHSAYEGENLSVSGMSEDDVCIGDIFRVGTAVVQVSQPRQPCSTLAVRYDRSDMVKLVVDSGRTGFYFKVLQNGVVRQGDTISLIASDPDRVSVTFANQIFHHDRQNREGIDRVLAVAALSASWRESFQKLKENAEG